MKANCPSCRTEITIDERSLNAPPGRIAYMKCSGCGHKAVASAFLDEHKRQEKAAAKSATAERDRIHHGRV